MTTYETALGPVDPADQWQEALKELASSMTQATFDTWLRPARLLEVDGQTLRIGVPNAYARDWLENQLKPIVRRAVLRTFGKSMDLVFSVTSQPDTHPAEDRSPNQSRTDTRLTTEPDSDIDAIEIVDFNPADSGWFGVSFYAENFWQPYLGPGAYAVYRLLLSWWWYTKHTGHRPSVQRIANTVADGNRHLITGRAPRGTGDNARPAVEGYFEILEREDVAHITRLGEGRNIKYRFAIRRRLPLLTPAQVEKLPPALRDAHTRYLEGSRVEAETWQQIELETLAGKRPERDFDE